MNPPSRVRGALDAPDLPILIPSQPDDVVWVLDAAGATLSVDDRVHELIGYWPDELADADESLWWRRVHPHDRARVRAEFDALFAVARAFEVEFRYRRRDGRWIWVDARAAALVRCEDGVCAHVVVRGAADRRKAAITERRALDAYRAVCATAPVVVVRRDARRDYALGFVSRNVTGLLGYTPAEIVRASAFLTKLVHVDDRAPLRAATRLALQRGASSCELRVLHKSGGYTWIREETHAVRGASGRPSLVSYWSSLAAERRHLEAERRLEAALHVLGARTSDAVAVCAGSTLVHANAALATALGHEVGTLGGADVLDLVARSDRSTLAGLLHDAVAAVARPLVDVRWMHRSGEPVHLRCAGLPLAPSDPPSVLLIGVPP